MLHDCLFAHRLFRSTGQDGKVAEGTAAGGHGCLRKIYKIMIAYLKL